MRPKLLAVPVAASLVLLFAAAPALAAPTRYEAESATIFHGVVESNWPGFSGTGFVNYTNEVGSYVQWTVNATTAGSATLAIRFANGTTTNRPMDITVNGVLVADELAFPGTGAWSTWQTKTITATLNAGGNTVRATATTVNGGPNVDFLDVEVTAEYQAEDATISQGTVATNHLGYTGTGFVDYTNVAGSYVQFSVTVAAAGSTRLAFRHANGTTANRPMDITVNGVLVANDLAFNPTGNWDTWAVVSINASLNAGANTVRATAVTANGGPNLDKLTVGGGGGGTPGMAVAPYEYFGWGSPPDPVDVMAATGVRWFTLAFILSDGTCNPAWDGSRPLTGGNDQAKINAIRAAGGDVMVSFGGWSGNKLGERCSSASALAGAYQKVIDAYGLKVIDIDIENTEFASATVRQRVIDALKIVKVNNSGIKTILTFGTTPTGPDATGRDLINRGAASGLDNDVWTVMPFNFGGHTGTMGDASVSAAEGLRSAVQSAYGYSTSVTYTRIGISSMNGRTDLNETVTLADFQQMLSYAQQHHIGRLTFWSVNRDRQCTAGLDPDSCSGVSQSQYAYTKIFVQYTG